MEELQSLDKALKDTEAALSVSLAFCSFHQRCSHIDNITYKLMKQCKLFSMSLLCCNHPQGQIEELAAENKALLEKFTAEENRRKELAESSQVLLYLCYTTYYNSLVAHL